jgi:adenosine deaminase
MPLRTELGLRFAAVFLLAACSGAGVTACSSSGGGDSVDPDAGAPADDDAGATDPDAAPVPCVGTPAECAVQWEQAASDRYDGLLANPTDLAVFLKGMPKGGDLHNHLTGAVYAETYLDWARTDGDCVSSTTSSVVFSSSCGGANVAIPTSGDVYDQIVRAWSMKDFVAGSESGHNHFFSTFGKYGVVAGVHRDDDFADVLKRAADENEVYVETMFNLGKNVSTLASSTWSAAVTADVLETFYDQLIAAPTFAAKVTADVKVVNDAASTYRDTLGCSGSSAPPACNVGLRFIAQVSRTGALDGIFGQLVSAYEMAAQTPSLVALNLSSPEDDVDSLKNYAIHMAMLDFLYNKYTVTKKSPLHVTLHAGELAPAFLPSGYETANTFHVKDAVAVGHAERIGHGIDILSETDPSAIMDDMAARGVMVEVCLSSNAQILEVSGANHPLSEYMKHNVPVALATDDQGVSRSSMAGEYMRAATDQKLTYRQLKTMARTSLEHAFLPGASLWTSLTDATPVADCAATDTMGVGDPATDACKAFLDANERAATQWELERRFRAFESQ